MKKCPLCQGPLQRKDEPEYESRFFSCPACRITIYQPKKKGSLGNGEKYFIDAKEMSLEGWLSLIAEPPDSAMIIRRHFPSNAVRDGYIATIHQRTEGDVIKLVERFLVESGSYQSDESRLHHYLEMAKTNPSLHEKLGRSTHYQRLFRYFMFGWKEELPWEGITWVLDLLPDHPELALQGLNAYYTAHLTRLSDGMIYGWGDAEQLIRAKFIGTPATYDDALKLLLKAGDRTFECLVERLYHEMGYKTELTPPQKDGGRDVIAWKDDPGHQQRLLVECKLYQGPVGLRYAKLLCDTVSHERATKGVLVTTARFTKGCRQRADGDSQLELINGKQLIPLMNRYLGTNWPLRTG